MMDHVVDQAAKWRLMLGGDAQEAPGGRGACMPPNPSPSPSSNPSPNPNPNPSPDPAPIPNLSPSPGPNQVPACQL